LIDTVVSL